MIAKIFDYFRRNIETPKKYVVNCNPSLRMQLPDAIALRRAAMGKFPESEEYEETFCFGISIAKLDGLLAVCICAATRYGFSVRIVPILVRTQSD